MVIPYANQKLSMFKSVSMIFYAFFKMKFDDILRSLIILQFSLPLEDHLYVDKLEVLLYICIRVKIFNIIIIYFIIYYYFYSFFIYLLHYLNIIRNLFFLNCSFNCLWKFQIYFCNSKLIFQILHYHSKYNFKELIQLE